MKFYTLFEEGHLFENVTDDMNSTKSWARSGMVWTDRSEAQRACDSWRPHAPHITIVELHIKKA